MPTQTYIPKERYFCIVNPSILEIELPEPIKDKLGYFKIENEVKTYSSISLGESAQIIRELDDGNFVISIQLSPNSLLPVKCVSDFITEEDFNSAVEYYSNYGINEFLNLEEFKQLKFKTN